MPLVIGEANFDSILKDESVQTVLLTGNALRLKQATLKIVSHFVSLNIPVILITLNEPYTNLKTKLKKRSVETGKMIFIDAVSYSHDRGIDKGNCVFIKSPANLTDLAIAIDGAIDSLDYSERVVLFDSVSILTMYNPVEEVVRFFHSIVSKIRLNKVRGVFMLVRKQKEELFEGVSQFCDVITRI